MQHIGGLQNHRAVLHGRRIGILHLILVVEVAHIVPVNGHAVGHQRVQRNDLAFPVSDNLGVGVAPQQQMGHGGFPKHKAGHLRVRLVMENAVQRMLQRLFLTSALPVLIQVYRQTGDGFGQNADAGVDRRHLHGGAFIHWLARGGLPEEESVTAAVGAVSGLIPGME